MRRALLLVSLAVLLNGGCASGDSSGTGPVSITDTQFYGRVVEIDFDEDWVLSPEGAVIAWGPPRLETTVGPGVLRFEDGRELSVPAGTPGGNDCRELIRDEDWWEYTGGEPADAGGIDSAKPCWLYGRLDPDGDVAWFGIAAYQRGDTVTIVRQVIDVDGRTATVEGGVEFRIADDQPGEWVLGGDPVVHSGEGQVACGPGPLRAIEQWWPYDGPNSAYVQLSTGEIVFIECPMDD